MSNLAAQDIKQQIRQAVDVTDLIGSYLELRRQGRLYVGLCPWHDDSRPSLQVNPERQSWKCWVCNVGGDIFSFVMQREGVDFREALSLLAERAGIELHPYAHKGRSKPGSAGDKATLYKAMSWAVQQYHECLVNSDDASVARDYLRNRGLTDETARRFRIGFAPNRWQWLTDRARTTPFSVEVLQAVGLLGKSTSSGQHYDRFKGRVLFPIRDVQGRAIGMGGRILPEFANDKTAKYVNSPETRLFSKSDNLYGLDAVRDTVSRRRHVVVVEGYTDALMAWQFGFDNVTAVLGTALGPRHIQLLRRYADSITLVLDGDVAGQKRTNEILELFVANQIDLRIVTLPEGLDPCDFLLKHGVDPFRDMLGQAVDAIEHKISVSTQGLDPDKDTHRANQVLEELLAILARAPRLQADTTGSIRLRQQHILSRLSRQFRIDEVELRNRLSSLRNKPIRMPSPSPSPEQRDNMSAIDLDPIERELLELLVRYPEMLDEAAASVSVSLLTQDAAKEIYGKFLVINAEGGNADFGTVLTVLDDPRHKNILVELDEESRRKPAGNAEQKLRDTIEALERRRTKHQRRQQLAALEQSELTDEDQLKLLKQIFNQD